MYLKIESELKDIMLQLRFALVILGLGREANHIGSAILQRIIQVQIG